MDRIDKRSSTVFREVVSVIKEGSTEAFVSLMQKNPNLFELVDASKATLLHYSSAHGNEDMVQYLLNGGMTIDDQDSNGNTALMVALRKKQTFIVIQTLLSAGSDITLVNNENKSALHIAFEEQYFTPQIGHAFLDELAQKTPKFIDLADRLIEAGCLLHQACHFRWPILTDYFLWRKIPVNTMHSVSKETALHVATSVEDRKSVQVILKNILSSGNDDELNRNCYVNAQDFTKTTPLMAAVTTKNKIIVQSLLAAGADMLMVNSEYKSALHLVFDERYFLPALGKLFFDELCKKYSTYQEVAQMMINHGARIYQVCSFNCASIVEYICEKKLSLEATEPMYKFSPLHVAVKFADIDTVKVLLKYKVSVNAHDYENRTPLAHIYGSSTTHTSEKIELLKILLSQQDISTFTLTSKNHFQISRTLMCGNQEAIRVVLQSGNDFTVKNHFCGKNILHYLAVNTEPKIVDELQHYIKKCDIHSVDNEGLSPLHVAVLNNNVDMIQFLLDQNVNPNCAIIPWGYTPIFNAFVGFKPKFKKQFDQYIELLLQNNADPQCICYLDMTDTDLINKSLTIFDAARKFNSISRMKPVIAHLAVLEKLGVPITELTYAKLNLHPGLKDYFHRCQKLISQNIVGTVTLFQLLTGDERKIARLSANKELVLTFERFKYKKNLKSIYPYYHNTVKKRILNGIQCRRFLDQIAGILSELLEDRFSQMHLIVDKIIYFLDDESLQLLHKSWKATREKCNDNMIVT